MVYSNKLVAVIKVNGNIIREDDEIVKIPFGSEYSIYFKNLSLKNIVIGVDIDGKDVLSGTNIMIQPNKTHELFGFLDGNQVTNRFKFIQKTDNIVNHRGDQIDDGFINITFQFEKPYTISYYPPIYTEYNWYVRDPIYPYYGSSSCKLTSNSSVYTCNTTLSDIKPDEGITVRGSQINEQYKTTYTPILEENINNIIIRLKGYINNKSIEKPIYTNTKLICETCGRKNRSNMKFCPECGTSLK